MWWCHASTIVLALLFTGVSKAATTARTPEQSYQLRLEEIERYFQQQQHTATQWLTTNDGKYLTLQRNHLTEKSNGVVIVTHDVQQNPAWPGLVESALATFPRYGWDVLSVAMPYIELDQLNTAQLNAEPTNQQQRQKLFDCLAQAFNQARQSQPDQIVLMLQGGYVDEVLSLFQQYQQQPDGLILVSNPSVVSQHIDTDLAPLQPALLDIVVTSSHFDIESILAQRQQQNGHKNLLYRQLEWQESQPNTLQASALAHYTAGWLASLSKGRLKRKIWRGQAW